MQLILVISLSAAITAMVAGDFVVPNATTASIGNATTEHMESSGSSARMIWPQLSSSLTDIWSTKLNVIAGIPLTLIASLFDLLCSTALPMLRVPKKYTPNIADMKFQYMSGCRNHSVPILKADTLWRHKDFDRTKSVVILATGWRTTINDSSTAEALTRAFLCRNDVNVIIVDAAKYVDTLYKWATLNTDEVGRNIAVGLVRLVRVVPLRNIHLIGHSLGAHIMGAAGRYFFQYTGRRIPRITGLDAAKPCFYRNETIMALNRGDAVFTDAIHSNNGIAGKREAYADADYYPSGPFPLPKGCADIGCAHGRAWEYYAESVHPGNGHNFAAHKCSSWRDLETLKCSGRVTAMGYAADRRSTGLYLVDVNRKAPYGTRANAKTAAWLQYNCQRCSGQKQKSP